MLQLFSGYTLIGGRRHINIFVAFGLLRLLTIRLVLVTGVLTNSDIFFIKADQIYSIAMHIHHSTHINDISTALQYYQRAFHCCETILIPTDKTFKDLWVNIVRYYLNFDHQEEAIAYLNRTLKLCVYARNIKGIHMVYGTIMC